MRGSLGISNAIPRCNTPNLSLMIGLKTKRRMNEMAES